MLCEEVMKRGIECVTEQESIGAAARRMRDRDVGFLPVWDEGSRKVLGTITDRDIVIRACVDDGRPLSSTKVGDIMTRDVVACRPGDDLRRAEELMGKHHKSRILVTDDGDRLVGVISLSDVAQHDQRNSGRTVRAISEREAVR